MMKKSKMRMRICTALLIGNILFIWCNSLLPGSISGAISQAVRDVLAFLFPGGSENPQSGHGLIRKLGHCAEFCALGIWAGWLLRMLRTKPLKIYGIPLLVGAAVACVDETIQRFVPDRGPSIIDVGIDTLGTALGICIISLISFIKKKSTIKNLEENVL